MAGPVQVVIVDESQRTLDNLRRLLRFEPDIEVVGMAQTAEAGIAEARQLCPDVVLLDAGVADSDPIRAIRRLKADRESVAVVVMTVEQSRDHLSRLVEAGADGYLVKPFSADDLVSIVRAAAGREAPVGSGANVDSQSTTILATSSLEADSGRTPTDAEDNSFPPGAGEFKAPSDPSSFATQAIPVADLKGTPWATAPAGDPTSILAAPGLKTLLTEAPTLDPVASAKSAEVAVPDRPLEHSPPVGEDEVLAERSHAGELTLVWSGKGGVGKTMVAINVATLLAEELGSEVALVDLDLQFGDVGVLLGAENSKSISAIVSAWPEVDAPMVGSLMPEVIPGLRVLVAPVSPELADLVTAAHVRTTLGILKDSFDHVVVDASSHLGDAILEAIELASRIILVTDLDIHSIKEAKLSLKMLERLSVPNERIHLVCNRLDSGSNVSVGQMEASLRFPVAARIPAADKLFAQAINKGMPVTHLFPDAEVSQRFREFVGSLVPLPSTEQRQGARGNRLRFWPRSSAS